MVHGCLCLCLFMPGAAVLSPGCLSLGEFCTLLLSEHPCCGFSVAPSDSQSDSWLSHSKTNHLFSLHRNFYVTSSHISVPSRGGVGQHNQSLHSSSSHSSKSEYVFQLSESVSSPTSQLQIGLGDCILGGMVLGRGYGKMLLKSFMDLSSTDISDDDTPCIGTHTIRLDAGLYASICPSYRRMHLLLSYHPSPSCMMRHIPGILAPMFTTLPG